MAQPLGEIEDAGERVFGHGERVAGAARRGRRHVAAPQVAEQEIAGTGRALVEPLEPLCPRAQVEGERPAAQHHLRVREQTVALLAAAGAVGARREVAARRERRPGVAIFPVEPAAGVGKLHARIDRLDFPALRRAQPHNAQHVDFLHRPSLPRRMCAAAPKRQPIDHLAASRYSVRGELVPRTRSSPNIAANTVANFGFKAALES